jgi:hypothetical protein
MQLAWVRLCIYEGKEGCVIRVGMPRHVAIRLWDVGIVPQLRAAKR